MRTIQTGIGEFINHCKYEKNLSVKTIEAYSSDLAQFRTFLIEKDFPFEIEQITKAEIRVFLEEISSHKPKSIKRKIATLKVLFNFLEFEDKIPVSPFRKMRIKIQEPKTLPRVMDIKDVNEIFKLAYLKNTLCKNSTTYSYLESLVYAA